MLLETFQVCNCILILYYVYTGVNFSAWGKAVQLYVDGAYNFDL